MKKIKRILPLLVFINIVFLTACGNGGNEGDQTPTYDTTPTGPAPDNEAANNSSLADTGVNQTDSIKTRDSLQH